MHPTTTTCRVIAAAAGYGKTTALRGWYPAAAARWHRGLPPGRGEPAEVLAGAVLEEARAGARRVVFDDLPALPVDTSRAVHRLVGDAAVVVLATRWPPVAPVPSRADVGPAELSLDPAGVAGLLSTGYELNDGDLPERVRRATSGWPVLVHLAAETLRSGGVPHGPLVPAIAAPDGLIASYLAEEVLPALPEEARRLLTELGDLAPVGAALCEALGHPGAGATVRLLTRSGLLTTAGSPPPVPGGPPPCLHVVPVVAEVVRRSRRCDPAPRAATYFDEHGPPIAAALAFGRSGQPSRCARVLERHGEAMLAGGHGESIVELVEALPADARSTRLRLLLGDALRDCGSLDAAASAYASTGLPADSAALAWRIGRIHYKRGDATAALGAFAAAGPGPQPPEDAALLAAWTANAHLLAGEHETALTHARAAVDAAHASGSAAVLATAHVSVALCLAKLGDDAGSEEHYGLALPMAERAGDVVLLTRIFINRTYRLLCAARFADALASAGTCARYAAAAGQAGLRVIATCNEADALAMLGRFDEAIREYETAVAAYRGMGTRRVAGAHLGLGEVYRRRGWQERARGAYEAAIRIATETGNEHVLGPARAGLAQVLLTADPDRAAAIAPDGTPAAGWVAVRLGDHATAAAIADAACAVARERHDPIGLADALELRGAALAGLPDRAAARAALGECHAIWVVAGAVVEAARVRVTIGRRAGSDADDRIAGLMAGERLRAAGAVVADMPLRSGRAGAVDSAPEVSVRALGRFEVLIDGTPVPAARWQSRKARDLLRILVARRGRPVPRDELCELLWPDDDAARTGHRLSVLLSIVRGVLDPAKARAADHYLVADQASVALDVTRMRVDVEDFLAYVARARRLLDAGEQAEARELLGTVDRHHHADAFEDEPYAPWSSALREETRAGHLNMLRMLVRVSDGDPDAVAGYLLRLLERDPYDEGAHRRLVRCMARAGRHGEARRAFDRYGDAMRAIGVRPPDLSILSGRSRSAPHPA